jgi:uncharacterized protein YktB (UPF0637 family)
VVTYKWKRGYLVDYFSNQTDVKSLRIATAYFSEFGLELLMKLIKNNRLLKSEVIMYLSTEFSNTKAAELLTKLKGIATVYIVEDLPLHAKVYLFEKKQGVYELVHGSANFTKGGFEDNLEFITVQQCNDMDISQIKLFFDYCENNSKLVDDEIIQFYKDCQEELEQLNQLQQKIRKKIRKRITKDDSFGENDYDLKDYYFTYEDYETLFKRNAHLNNEELRERRKVIRDKLISIHKLLQKHVVELDLHPHWNSKNITSGIEPNMYNHNRVSWIGVRYGKTEHEVKQLNAFLSPPKGYSGSKDEYMGFQKHSCIQFCLVRSGFEIVLFHAVANDAVDRGYLTDLIEQNDKKKINRIIREIEKLKGEGFKWYITDTKNDKVITTFSFDENEAKDFITFYKAYDRAGYESFCRYSLFPDHPILRDRKEIAKFVYKKIKQLLPLYQLITFRNKYVYE